MKLKLLILAVPLVTVLFLFSNHGDILAQYTNICNDPDMSEEDLQTCENEYNDCQAMPYAIPATLEDSYNTCIGNEGCNSINRYTSFDRPDDCIGWEERVTPGKYEYDWYDEIKAYCDCIDNCKAQYTEKRYCDEELDECCSNAAQDDSSDGNKITFSTDMVVTIKRIEGDVEIQRRGDENYYPATVGDQLQIGDYIATGFESKCVIVVEKVAEMHIKELTNFAIGQLFVQGNLAKTAISLRMGEVTTNVHTPKGMRASFEIETPTSTIGSRGTTFRVRYDDETGLTECFVYEGIVDVTEASYGTEIALNEGEMLHIDLFGNVSDIQAIPGNEQLTDAEKALFEQYEAENSETDDTETDTDTDSEGSDANFDPTALIAIACCSLLCLVGLGFGLIIILLLLRKKK